MVGLLVGSRLLRSDWSRHSLSAGFLGKSVNHTGNKKISYLLTLPGWRSQEGGNTAPFSITRLCLEEFQSHWVPSWCLVASRSHIEAPRPVSSGPYVGSSVIISWKGNAFF